MHRSIGGVKGVRVEIKGSGLEGNIGSIGGIGVEAITPDPFLLRGRELGLADAWMALGVQGCLVDEREMLGMGNIGILVRRWCRPKYPPFPPSIPQV